MVATTLCVIMASLTLTVALRNPPIDIIRSVLQFYHRGCVIILHSPTSGFMEEFLLFVLSKQLTRYNIQAAVTPIHRFDYSMKEFRCRSRSPPLCVLLSSDASVKRALQRLSDEAQLNGPAWLLFMKSDDDIQEFFDQIYLPINSKFLIAQPKGTEFTMTEIYHVVRDSLLHILKYGTWSQEGETNFSTQNLYERRNDLHGHVFLGTALEEPPLTVLKEENGVIKVEGFFGEVWRTLEGRLNFTTQVIRALDNAYGSLDNGSWNGMIEMLMNKEVDFGISEFRITTERVDVIDYTLPIILSKYQIFIREPSGQNLIWGNFLAPFTTRLWLSVLFCIIIFALFCAVTFYANQMFLGFGEDGELEVTFWDSLHIVFGAFCQQGQSFTPRSNSCRVVFLSIYVVGVVLLAAYSAALVSFLAKRKPVLPFNNLEELLKDGTYKLGLLQKSAEFNVFYQSKDKLLNETYNKMIINDKDSMPTSSQDGLIRTCQRKFAFFVSYDIAQGLMQQLPCRIIDLPGDSFQGSVSMALTKNSPYREMINYYLHNLRIGGVLQRLRNGIWPKHFPDPIDPWITVDIHDIIPLLTVLAGGIAISLLILFLERMFQFLSNRSISNPLPWAV